MSVFTFLCVKKHHVEAQGAPTVSGSLLVWDRGSGGWMSIVSD